VGAEEGEIGGMVLSFINPGIQDFRVFLAAALMVALTPGQDTLYVLGRTVAQGAKAGLASVAGILSGAAIHVVAGALGLSALLIASPDAFLAMKLAGGVYLIYLGIRMLIAKTGPAEIPTEFVSSGFAAIWRQGLLTNFLNPKVALFILAFIPQFIREDAVHKSLAFAMLGSCFFVIGTIWLLCIVGFAAAIGRRLGKHARFGKWLNWIAGALFVLLGLRLLIDF